MIDLEHSLGRWLLFFAALVVLIAVKVFVRRRRMQVAAQAKADQAERGRDAANDDALAEADSDSPH